MSPNRSNPLRRAVSLHSPSLLLVFLVGFQECCCTHSDPSAPPMEVTQFNGTLSAVCRMRPSSALPSGLPKVYGHVLFRQQHPHGTLQVLLRLSGFPKSSSRQGHIHAVHIHQYGDLSQGCDSTGGHYNPNQVPHPGHPGDFGNFVAYNGRINDAVESGATLFGGPSVMGRAVVIHEKADDLGQGGDKGSLLHGNAGRRLGCCVIGVSSPKQWEQFHTGPASSV